MTRRRDDREARLGETLERVRLAIDVKGRRANDPVDFLHDFDDPEDQELVGLFASAIAFGNAKTIRQKVREVLERLGPHPARVADDGDALFTRLDGWVHRVFRGEDIARLLLGGRVVQRQSGTLGARFESDLAAAGTLRGALARFTGAIRDAGGLLTSPAARVRRGPAHLLPDVEGGSGSKRLLLYLRWMVRRADGVDLGLWTGVDPGILLIPVDTHIHKLSRNVGLTRRKDLSWQTAEEVTAGLARFDPADPVKYDFPLCHLGMLQRCPSRKDPVRCEGCGVMPVCLHWQARPTRAKGRVKGRARPESVSARAVRR